MNVESVGASSLSQLAKSEAKQTDPDHRVQDVFSEVLALAGRQGYESARELSGEQTLDEDIQSSWSDWFDVQRTGRYQQAKNPEQLKQGFGEVLHRAHAEGGYFQPREFLNSLTPDELAVVQNTHWLAAPIEVDSLTEEGALNLLLPPAAQVDLNHDGLTQSGKAYGLRFPNSDTPGEVVAAWEEATEGLPLEERMHLELQMILPAMLTNVHLHEDGTYSHHFEPGDPEFVNPFANPEFSYVEATQDQLDHLDFVKSKIPEAQYNRRTEFWNRLQALLNEKGSQ